MNEIVRAWKKAGEDYCRGLINSERSLQAVLFRELCNAFSAEDIRIFVEPRMSLAGNKYPDLVICKGSEILAIIELKFVPHGYSHFRDDLQKLIGFAQTQDPRYQIALDPATGKYSADHFEITPNTCLVFAVVSQSDSVAVSGEDVLKYIPKGLQGRFLHLHGSIDAEIRFEAS